MGLNLRFLAVSVDDKHQSGQKPVRLTSSVSLSLYTCVHKVYLTGPWDSKATKKSKIWLFLEIEINNEENGATLVIKLFLFLFLA